MLRRARTARAHGPQWESPGLRWPEHVPAAGTSCGASWRWREAWASARSPTTGRCSSSCCPPASTRLRRAARTPSAPCRPACVTSATSWTTARSASTAWVSPRRPAAAGRGRAVAGRAGVRHGGPGAGPQLLPRPTPRLRLPLCRLLHAGLLAAQPPAPALCARRRTQFFPVHRPLLLLPVGSWPVVKGKAEGQNRAPTNTWAPRTAGCACAPLLPNKTNGCGAVY